MQDFFFEFEEYVRKNYGEKHFFKTLLETSIQPLHDALEDVTSEDVIQSIFGDIDSSKLQKTLDDFKLPELKGASASGTLGHRVSQNISPKREAGLSSKILSVNIKSIDPKILKALSSGKQGTISSIGGGVGKVAAGIGVGAMGISAAMAIFEKFGNFDADAVKDNVVTLLSISDSLGGKTEMLKEGGTFYLTMLGLGVGLAVFGVGSGIAGMSDGLLKKFNNPDWADSIVKNVTTLLSISDSLGGKTEMLKEGGTFALAMTGIGIGLAAFGYGSGIAGMSDGLLKKFNNPDWADSIVKNVTTLLSISDSLGGKKNLFGESGTFALAMTGIGIGLAAFGVGQSAAGIAGFIKLANEGIAGKSFGQGIKDDVITLLSISDSLGGKKNLLGESGTFALAMLGIGSGLAVLGVGQGIEGGASAIIGIKEFFTGESNADRIVKNVITLLSISDALKGKKNLLGESGTFALAMLGIGSGLAVLGVGKGLEGGATAISGIINFFSGNEGESNTERIVREVNLLMSLGSGVEVGQSIKFKEVMVTIMEGLGLIATGNVVGSLGNAGAAIISFITGEDSPMKSLLSLAENGEKLMEGAKAIELIGKSLGTFGKSLSGVSIDDFDFEKMAKNMGKALPFLDALWNGGKPGFFSIDFGEGLKGMEGDIDKMALAISKVNVALGRTTSVDPSLTPESTAEANNTNLRDNEDQYRKRRDDLKQDLTELFTALAVDLANATIAGSNQITQAVSNIPGGGDIITNNTYNTSREAPTASQRSRGSAEVGR